MKLSRIFFFSGCILLSFSNLCYANVIWPAIYVGDSYYRFWYLAIITVLLEAYVLFYFIKCSLKKAFLISVVANVFSATIGLYLLVFGMIGWHFVVDNFVRGTFHIFNKIATIIMMFLLSSFLETILVRIIWKYKIRRTTKCLIIGNFISYLVVAIDLFAFGGWSRSF